MPDPVIAPPTTPTLPPPAKHTEEEAKSILRNLVGALADDIVLKPLPPETPPVVTPPVVVADPVVPVTPVTEPPKPPEAPPTPVVPLTSDEVLASQKRIEAKLAEITGKQNQPPTVTPPPVTPPVVDPDAEFEKTLPEENREIIDLLKWADDKPEFKGRSAEMRQYFKRESDLLATNPSAEDLEEFRKKNRPNLPDAAIRRLSREKIKAEVKSEAVEEVRKETSKELADLREKQREFEIKPVLAKASEEFRARFATQPKLPEGLQGLEPELAKTILDAGFNDAVQQRSIQGTAFERTAAEHPIEAPILLHYAIAADEYMDLVYGMKAYEPNNQMHVFLQNFLFSQEQAMLKAEPEKRVRDGRSFLSTNQYTKLAKENPDEAAKHWMFDNSDVRRMLEIAMHRAVAGERDKIRKQAEKMGFVKKEVEKTTPATPPVVTKPAETTTPANPPVTPAQPATPSPKGGATISPGPASTAPAPNEALSIFETNYPGLGKQFAGQT